MISGSHSCTTTRAVDDAYFPTRVSAGWFYHISFAR